MKLKVVEGVDGWSVQVDSESYNGRHLPRELVWLDKSKISAEMVEVLVDKLSDAYEAGYEHGFSSCDCRDQFEEGYREGYNDAMDDVAPSY